MRTTRRAAEDGAVAVFSTVFISGCGPFDGIMIALCAVTPGEQAEKFADSFAICNSASEP
jgi:hypothetical protein